MRNADPSIQRVLERHHIDPASRLGGGMEAEVYACDADTVLKIYRDAGGHPNLTLLRWFYAELAEQTLPFAVPSILKIDHVEGRLVSIERRLHGRLMADVLSARPDATQVTRLMHTYLDAVVALSRVRPPGGFERFKLFDPLHLSDRKAGDWNHYLARYVIHQAASEAQYLAHDVRHFERKMARLVASLSAPYSGRHQLIHGDFSPGNLLLDERQNVAAVFDFGMMTMFGDPLYEHATGWVFFDMYDALGVGARDLYLGLLLERLGAESTPALYRYLLVYSVIGANAYSPECTDDHYLWCVENLNNADYWTELPGP
jgi:hypothetical protein